MSESGLPPSVIGFEQNPPDKGFAIGAVDQAVNSVEQSVDREGVMQTLQTCMETGNLRKVDDELQLDANSIRAEVGATDQALLKILDVAFHKEGNLDFLTQLYERFGISGNANLSSALNTIRQAVLSDPLRYVKGELATDIKNLDKKVIAKVKASKAYQLKEKIESPERKLLNSAAARSVVELNSFLNEKGNKVFEDLIGNLDDLTDQEKEGMLFQLQRKRLERILGPDKQQVIESAMMHMKQVTKVVLSRDPNAKVAGMMASMHDWFKYSKEAGVELGLHELSSGVAAGEVMAELVAALNISEFSKNKEVLQVLMELVGYTHGEDEFPGFASLTSPVIDSDQLESGFNVKDFFTGKLHASIRRLFGSVYLAGGRSTEVLIFEDESDVNAQTVRGYLELVSAADKLVGNNFESFIKINSEAPNARLLSFNNVDEFIKKSILLSYEPNMRSPVVQKWQKDHSGWEAMIGALDKKVAFMTMMSAEGVRMLDAQTVRDFIKFDDKVSEVWNLSKEMAMVFDTFRSVSVALNEKNVKILNATFHLQINDNDFNDSGKITQALIRFRTEFDEKYKAFMCAVESADTGVVTAS